MPDQDRIPVSIDALCAGPAFDFVPSQPTAVYEAVVDEALGKPGPQGGPPTGPAVVLQEIADRHGFDLRIVMEKRKDETVIPGPPELAKEPMLVEIRAIVRSLSGPYFRDGYQTAFRLDVSELHSIYAFPEAVVRDALNLSLQALRDAVLPVILRRIKEPKP